MSSTKRLGDGGSSWTSWTDAGTLGECVGNVSSRLSMPKGVVDAPEDVTWKEKQRKQRINEGSFVIEYGCCFGGQRVK